MAAIRSEEFKRDAVRIALTSALTQGQVASDLGMTRRRLCQLMGVTDRGLRVWKHPPPPYRRGRDMVLLAHIRDQHRSSLGRYGRPRMTEKLNELGLGVAQRRVGRVRRENSLPECFLALLTTPERHPGRSQRAAFKRTTDSGRAFNVAPHLLRARTSPRGAEPEMGRRHAPHVWTREG